MSDSTNDGDYQAGDQRASGFNTRAVRLPAVPPLSGIPLSPPVFYGTNARAVTSQQLGSAFRDRDPGVYTRFGHPGLMAAAATVARLEGAEDALVFSSGMAAITTTLTTFLRSGDQVVAQRHVFAQTFTFLKEVLGRFGVETRFIADPSPQEVVRSLNGRTRIVYIESPSNPELRVVDLGAVAEAVRAVQPGVLIVADNTFATPYLQNPLALGATLVVHSGSKYLGGHNDLLAGAVAGPSDLIGRIRETQILLGGILDPHGAWLLQRGIRTLGLRVQRASDTALFLATWLASQPGIVRVNYPWLGPDESSFIARRQMRAGGAMISFEAEGGLEGARRFVNALRDIAIATSLGGVETVVEVPYELDWHESEGITGSEVPPGLIRLSVGIEDPRDLQHDLAHGVAAVAGAAEAVR